MAGAATMQLRFLLLTLREKIIVHPAEELVHGPLFHPKWSAQYPLLGCSV